MMYGVAEAYESALTPNHCILLDERRLVCVQVNAENRAVVILDDNE
jgi:hypothetical protein